VQKIPVSDFAAGLFAANAILAALTSEERSSVHVDVSMMDLVLSWAALKSGHHFDGAAPRKPPVEPHYGVFRTKDDEYVALGVIEDHFWQRLCRYFGWEDLLEDPELATYERRLRNARLILPRLRAAVAKQERNALVEDLVSFGVPCSPVQSWAEVAQDPHVRHRELLGRGLDAGGKEYARIEIPYRYQDFEPDRLEHAPTLGEHTTEVIESLRDENANHEMGVTRESLG
jgi:crotonobetainyl-CoA:carnitine CoA-transferase CaiB-like acyl-CoA transferase